MVLGLFDALSLGAAVSFLIFGYPLVAAIGTASKGLTFAAYLAIVWVLGNWWAHDSLHIHHGPELVPLLSIEYGFHVTVGIAGAILAVFFVKALNQRTVSPQEGYAVKTKAIA
jgi:O-antigen/teichoic acid export membrane protein